MSERALVTSPITAHPSQGPSRYFTRAVFLSFFTIALLGVTVRGALAESSLESAEARRIVESFLKDPNRSPQIEGQLQKNVAKEFVSTLERLAGEGEIGRVETLVRNGGKLLSPGSEEMHQMERLQSALSLIDARLEAGEFTKFKAIQETLQTPFEREIYSLALRSRLLASATAHHHLPVRALRQLAAIPEKERDEEVLQAVIAAISKSKKEIVDKNNEDAIAEWERDWAWFKRFYPQIVDEQQRSQLAEINAFLTVRAVASNRIDAANDFFSEVIRWRVDPNEQNDRLRRDIILAAETEDARSFAHGRVAELERAGTIDLPLKLRVFFQGYYGTGAIYIVFWIFSGVILFFVVAYLLSVVFEKYQRWRGKQPAKVKVRPKSEKKKTLTNLTLKEQSGIAPPAEKQEEGSEAPPAQTLRREEMGMFQQLLKGGKKDPGYMHIKEEPDEYGRLLDKFGLDDSASEDDIKSAFRKIAKELHPDRVGPDAEKEFREFQFAYERLLEIRKSWFGR